MAAHRPRIAVVGAGPGGLLLARLLTQNSIPVTIFERDESPSTRPQGGTLDLHEDSGLQALKEAGLYSAFLSYARPEGEDLVIADKTGKRFMDQQGQGDDGWSGRPEIDREDLRRILLESVPAECIQWGQVLRSVGEDGVLHLQSSDEGPFELVVGADGAFSRVRPQVSTSVPFYSGISGPELRFNDVNGKFPAISKLVGRGSYFAFSDGKSLIAQRLGDQSIRVYAWTQKPENWVKEFQSTLKKGGQVAKEALHRDYTDWAPELQDLVLLADDDIVMRPLYMLPVGEKWEHRPGFTLIGDAAHLMTPFAGLGVNAALRDALELATAIVRHCKSAQELDLDAAVIEYEKGMFPRAEETARDTEENMHMLFGPDFPDSFMEKMKKMFPPQKAISTD